MNLLRNKQNFFLLIAILIIALFMRFYKLRSFQYFSGDEEIFYALLRRIANQGLILVTPNAQLASGIGSFFHLLSFPLYLLVDASPGGMEFFGSCLGVITAVLMFVVGTLVGGHTVGLIAAFLYSGSFLVSLFDRRWWALTPDSIFILISLIGLIFLVKRKYKFLLLSVIPASFAWHSDPSLAVILLAIVLTFLFFRIPLIKKEYFYSIVYLGISVFPTLLFEARHPGAIFRPFVMQFLREDFVVSEDVEMTVNPINVLENISRSLAVGSSSSVDVYFHYTTNYPKPPFGLIQIFLTVFLVFFPLVDMYASRYKEALRRNIVVVYLYFLSFIVGVSLYTAIFKYSTYQHYYVVIFPIFFLLASLSIAKMLRSRFHLFGYLFLLLFLAVNVRSLMASSIKYPVGDKSEIVSQIKDDYFGRLFSVYALGDWGITDGGWMTFFINQSFDPQRSYLNGGWDWIYRSYSLFNYDPNQPDGDYIVVFTPNDAISIKLSGELLPNVDKVYTVGHIRAVLLNNQSRWLNSRYLDLWQSAYQRYRDI